MIQPHDLSAKGQEALKMVEIDPGEELLWEVRKHPIGAYFIYLSGFFVGAAVLTAALVTAHFFKGDPLQAGVELGKFQPIVVLIGLVMTGFIVLLTLISAYLYRSNVMLITSEKVVQLLYKSLFNRSVSQLGVHEIEDVSVKQPTLFARLFNYGTMQIETAGERGTYRFSMAPDPYTCAKYVMGSKERADNKAAR